MYRQNHPGDPGMHNTPRQPGHYGDAYVHGDATTRVTYRRPQSFCERVRNSVFGIVAGLVLLCVASSLLFWNEGRAVQTAKSLDEGLRSVRKLKTPDVVFDENNGKLVYITGALKTSNALYDDMYNVAVHAVHLRRTVEMYQWVETSRKMEHKEGDVIREETTYRYHEEWRADLVRSTSFNNPTGHHNPKSFAIEAVTKTAAEVQVGSFYLSKGLVSQVSTYKQLTVKDPPKSAGVHLHNGGFFHGRDPMYPVIGDTRVKLEYAGLSGGPTSQLGSPNTVSVIGRQAANQVMSYQTEAGDVLEILYMGEYSAEKIFGREQANNSMMTWGVRFGGWLLMFIAFGCLTSIIPTLVDWLPIVREVVTFSVMMMNAAFAISLSLTIIALGWIWYRPLLGATILLMAAAPFVMARVSNARARREPAPPPRSERDFYD